MTPVEVASEMQRLSSLLDGALAYLRVQVGELAQAENFYRKARAQAWVGLDAKTAREKEDLVNALTADLRMGRDLADGMKQAALEAVRSRRTQISALQTLAGAMKAEAEFARTGGPV